VSPFEQVLAKYKRAGFGRCFDTDLSWHFLHGHVVASPTLFAMARPVVAASPLVTAVEHAYEPAKCDCWHVHVIAGSIKEGLTRFPFPLPLVSWQGAKRLVVLPVKRIHALENLFH
jgi:hypothetical protein